MMGAYKTRCANDDIHQVFLTMHRETIFGDGFDLLGKARCFLRHQGFKVAIPRCWATASNVEVLGYHGVHEPFVAPKLGGHFFVGERISFVRFTTVSKHQSVTLIQF